MKTIKCPQCNLVNFSTTINCKRCGYFFQEINPEVPQNAMVDEQPITSTAPQLPNINPQQVQSLPPNLDPKVQTTQPVWTPPNQYPTTFQPPTRSYSQFGASNPTKLKIKLAVISMILGILSFPIINMMIGIIFSIIGATLFGSVGAAFGFVLVLLFLPTGLITGITALVKANKRPFEYGGKGFAITGIVLSGFSILVIPMVAAIAIPNLLAARRSANEGSAISSIRTIADAQETYRGVRNTQICGDLMELAQNNLIDSVLASGTKSGYLFVISKQPQGCEIFAKPVNANGVTATGIRSFYYSTEEKIIRAGNKNGEFASRIDSPLETGSPSDGLTPRPKIASQK